MSHRQPDMASATARHTGGSAPAFGFNLYYNGTFALCMLISHHGRFHAGARRILNYFISVREEASNFEVIEIRGNSWLIFSLCFSFVICYLSFT